MLGITDGDTLVDSWLVGSSSVSAGMAVGRRPEARAYGALVQAWRVACFGLISESGDLAAKPKNGGSTSKSGRRLWTFCARFICARCPVFVCVPRSRVSDTGLCTNV